MYQSITNRFKSIDLSPEIFDFKLFKKRKSSCTTTNSCDSHTTLVDNEGYNEGSRTNSCETMSAEQFANAVGLEVESFNDVKPDLTILSVISQNASSSPATFSHESSSTTKSQSGYSFPKLDMNLFIPPPGYKSASPINIQSLQQCHLSTYDSIHKRRASEASYFPTPSRTVTDPYNQQVEENYLTEDDEDCKTHKRGRFTMTVERSSHWTASKGRRRRESSSRFSLTPADLSSSLTKSFDDVEEDLIVETFDSI